MDTLYGKAEEMEARLKQMHETMSVTGRTRDQLQALQAQHDELLTRHEEAVVAADEHAGTAAALQVELDNASAAAQTAQQDAEMHARAADELRGMVASLQTRVGEYQAKDMEVYTRIREAMEVAEKVRAACRACPALRCVGGRERSLRSAHATCRDQSRRRQRCGGFC